MLYHNTTGRARFVSTSSKFFFILSLTSFILFAAPDFYVSPTGSDQASGTSPQEPLATIQKAQEKVRAVNTSMTDDIHVYLMGGTYQLAETINFGTADGGTNGHYVIYQAYENEKPVISGGVQITGWTAVAEKPGVYKADISQYGFHEKGFRQLYVNGNRCIRARRPNLHPRDIGDVYLGNRDTDFYRVGEWRAAKKIRVRNSDVTGITNWEGVEFVPLLLWELNYFWLKNVEVVGNFADLTLHDDHDFVWTRVMPPKENGCRYYFENHYSFLDSEGEFFVNTSENMVYYMPRSVEDITTAQVIAPKVDTLIAITGTLDQPAHHIQFKGIIFEYSTWMRPSEKGHTPIQTELPNVIHYFDGTNEFNTVIRTGASLYLEASHNIHFQNNVFRYLGATAIDYNTGTDTCHAIGNVFYNISAMGMLIGEYYPDSLFEIHWAYNPEDKRQVCDSFLVKNNYFYKIGQAYCGAPAISAGYPRKLHIEHNEIYDLPYSGISVGWGWRTHPTESEQNFVHANRIHSIMTFLQDGGGIYTLGNQPGSYIDRNAIYDVRKYDPNYGFFYNIYLDEGTDNLTCADNCIYNTDNTSVMVRTNDIGENVLIGANGGPSVVSQEICDAAGLELGYESIKDVKHFASPVAHHISKQRIQGHTNFFPEFSHQSLVVKFTSKGKHQIQVVSVNGRILKTVVFDGTSKHTIDIHRIPAGMYFLKYKSINGIAYSKFLINN